MTTDETRRAETPPATACPRCAAGEAAARDAASPRSGGGGRGWLQTLAAVPAAALPLLPSFTCPACLAAYAGVLSAMGLGFLLREEFLAPVIVVALVLSLLAVARATRSHRNPWPLVSTVVGALAIVAGRLVWDVPALLYSGAGVLLLASLHNLWLKRPRKKRVASPSPAV